MKGIHKRLIGYAIILFLPGYWIASEVFYARSNSPAGISNIADFYRVFGQPTFVRKYRHDGQTFYHLYGRGPRLPWILAFPSSSPVYVFNSSGAFVEWSSDPGDDSRYQQRWPLREGQTEDPAIIRQQYAR